jgi:cytochrome c oxidase subunit 4
MDAMQEHRHPDEKPLPRISVYLFIGFVLTVITAVEVAAFYLNVVAWLLVTAFVILSLLKFVLVVMFFMHLRYDHKLFSIFFTGGLVLAIGVVLGLITLFDNFDIGNPPPVMAATPTPTIITVTPDAPIPGTGGGGTDGPGIFVSRGCGGCHVIEGVPGAVGVIGPEMTGIASRAGTRAETCEPGMSAEDYIRESIEKPEACIVPGYDNVMQPLRGMMSDDEFDILVEYLLTLQ